MKKIIVLIFCLLAIPVLAGTFTTLNPHTGTLQLLNYNPNGPLPTGATGPQGVTGITGSTGTNGTNGTDGSTGSTGATGFTGITGSTGTNGTNGTNGTDGATGFTGITGATGTNGTNGTNGTDGATGFTGITGSTGTNGTNGTDGSTGSTGPTGATGAVGTSSWVDGTGEVSTQVKVGIGTTAPSASLEVIGGIKATTLQGDGSQITGITYSALSGQATNAATADYATLSGTASACSGAAALNVLKAGDNMTGPLTINGADLTINHDLENNFSGLTISNTSAESGGPAGPSVILQNDDNNTLAGMLLLSKTDGGLPNFLLVGGGSQITTDATPGGIDFHQNYGSTMFTHGAFGSPDFGLSIMALPNGNIGINNGNPQATLDVAGSFKLADGSQGAGKLLGSDGSGNASWVNNSGDNTKVLKAGDTMTGSLEVAFPIIAPNILADANCEAPNTSAWTPLAFGTVQLTKEADAHSGSRSLGIIATSPGGAASQNILTNYHTYEITGWYKADPGTTFFSGIYAVGHGPAFGGGATTWTYFSYIDGGVLSNTIYFACDNGEVKIDDLSVTDQAAGGSSVAVMLDNNGINLGANSGGDSATGRSIRINDGSGSTKIKLDGSTGNITTIGYVGIGTTEPSATLEVKGSIKANDFNGAAIISNGYASQFLNAAGSYTYLNPLSFVPYVGASNEVNLNTHGLTADQGNFFRVNVNQGLPVPPQPIYAQAGPTGNLSQGVAYGNRVVAVDSHGNLSAPGQELVSSVGGINYHFEIKFLPVPGAVSYRMYLNTSGGTYDRYATQGFSNVMVGGYWLFDLLDPPAWGGHNSGLIPANSTSISRVGYDNIQPTARLHLPAGITDANGAPLKFTPGNFTTAAESGEVEFDGKHLYFSPYDAGARLSLDLASDNGTPEVIVTHGGIDDGFVGIHTNPAYDFDVAGNSRFTSSAIGGGTFQATGTGTKIMLGDHASSSAANGIALGAYSQANSLSAALGYQAYANAFQSLALGDNAIANGNFSTAMGMEITANAYRSTVIGTDNLTVVGSQTAWVGTDECFVVANGDNVAHLSNALTILKNGNVLIGGQNYYPVPNPLVVTGTIETTSNYKAQTKTGYTGSFNFLKNLVPGDIGTVEVTGGIITKVE